MGLFDSIAKPFTSAAEQVGGVVGELTGATAAGAAAERAAGVQARAAEAGIEEQRRQFDLTQELLSPFVQAGTGTEGVTGSLEAQQALLGLRGPEAQQAAISQLEGSPVFQSLVGQGEEALLQQASATGGLRGGNVQGALAQFRPNILNQLIESQFSNLGGLTQLGQSSAARVGAAGQQTGANIAQLLEQQGAAQAGGIIGKGSTQARTFQNLLGLGTAAAKF